MTTTTRPTRPRTNSYVRYKGKRGKKPPPIVRQRYFELRDQGFSRRRACEMCGISEGTGKAWDSKKDTFPEGLLVEGTDTTPAPKLAHELDADAKRALEDFPFFCKHYLDLFAPAFWVEIARVITQDPTCDSAQEHLARLHPHLRGLSKPLLPPHMADNEILQLLLIVHPGVGKTTLILAFILWRILQERSKGNREFSVTYGQKTDRLARRGLRQVKDWVVRPGLIAAFGRVQPEADDENTMWTKTEIAVAGMGGGKEATIAVWAVGASIRGTRPHLAVWDDPIDSDDAPPDKTKEIAEWWDDNAARRVEPGGALIVVGNYVSPNDFYHLLAGRKYTFDEGEEISEEAAWHVVKYPAHDDLRCPCDGTHPAYPVGCLLWPERWSFKQLERIRQDDPDKFQVQYQLTDEGTSEILVPEIWLKGGVGENGELLPGCLDEDRALWDKPKLRLPNETLVIGTLDPSPTKFAAVELWVWDNPFHHLVALERRRMRSPEYPVLIAEWTQRARDMFGHFDAWIVEKTGSQYLHTTKEMEVLWSFLGVTVIPHETQRNKKDADYGVWGFRNEFRLGRIRLPWAPGPTREEMRHFVEEHKTYPYGATDDTVMADWFYHLHRGKVPRLEETTPQMWRPSWLTRSAA